MDISLRDLKARVPLTDLVDLRLRNNMAICPFHEDRNPSLAFYADNFHCFGCGAHGDHLDWLTKYEGLSFADAVERMRSLAGIPRRPRATDNPDPAKNRERALAIWHEAKPIARTLVETYLTSRRIDISGLRTEALRFHPACPFRSRNRQPLLPGAALASLSSLIKGSPRRLTSLR